MLLSAASIERTEPTLEGDEQAVLWSMLDYYRASLLLKCADLDDAALRRRPLVSNLSLLGLLRHLTEVEHYWFAICFAGGPDTSIYCAENPDGDFDDEGDPATDLALHLEVIASSKILATGHSLDARAKGLRRGAPVNLRFIAVHLIEEYARHLGHADLLREAIDGRVGD